MTFLPGNNLLLLNSSSAGGTLEMHARSLPLSRREFCSVAAILLAGRATRVAWSEARDTDGYSLVARTDRARILKAAKEYLSQQPETITAFRSEKSPGGVHDFFSQADYFWPDPKNPDGPYINRDGQSNPDNFNEHRKAMIRLSVQMPALTAGWMLTGDKQYAQHAVAHLRAWFVAPATRMNPNLEFSQGVHGVSTGRNYGIIDTLHLVEVARAASLLPPGRFAPGERDALLGWFTEYLHWLSNSEKGVKERDTLNNHAICWALQAAEFARLVGDNTTRAEVRQQWKTVFVPNQIGPDGSFPKELARTKPYSYSIFNFDVSVMLCQSLLDSGEDLYKFQLADGRGICEAAAFLFPYLADKEKWPYAKDIEHFGSLPVRSPGLLFSGLACGKPAYLKVWERLNPDPTDPEIIRNYPVRQPLLWFPKQARS